MTRLLEMGRYAVTPLRQAALSGAEGGMLVQLCLGQREGCPVQLSLGQREGHPVLLSLGQREGYRSCWPDPQRQDSRLGGSPASPLCPGPCSPCRVWPRGSLLDAGRLSAPLSASLSRGPATSLASLDRPGFRELSVRWAGSVRTDDQGGAVGPLHPRRPARASVGRREGGAHRAAQEGVSGQAEG